MASSAEISLSIKSKVMYMKCQAQEIFVVFVLIRTTIREILNITDTIV